MMWSVVLVSSLFIGLSLQASTPSSLTYEAGVVEFSYEKNSSMTSAELLASNLAKYLEIMTNAPSTLDIIIFPESTLNGMLTAVETPEPKDNVSPCESENYLEGNLLKTLSCSARNHRRYVVVDITTKAACPDEDMIANNDTRNCSDRADGMSYYNTNVVFDRNGTLISRYRKFNLFGEAVDKPFKPSMVSFETDFGVKFGHFICFDLMFRYPALELVRNHNVTDIVFTTMWFSEMPFLTAAQVQKNWAYTNNVNLLAAGANNPSVGSTGSGIYAARKGSLISVMEGSDRTNLYTAVVPKVGLGDGIRIIENHVRRPREEVASLKLKRDQLDKYNMRFLSVSASPGLSVTSHLCHEDVCCDFTYGFYQTSSQEPSYHYAAAVYHGNRTFDGFADGGVVACAILACQTDDIATCGVRNESLTFRHQWHTLEITGSFPNGQQFFYLPTSLDTSIMPFTVDEFYYEQKVVDSNTYNISIKSLGRIRDFYAFGIYGRDFNLDEVEAEHGSAGFTKISYILLIFVSFVAIIRNMM